jgi:mono/diheme cytochrome c family protein
MIIFEIFLRENDAVRKPHGVRQPSMSKRSLNGQWQQPRSRKCHNHKGRDASMDLARRAVLLLVMVIFGFSLIEWAHADMAAPKKQAAGFDMKQVDRGRYLLRIAGCNDCHTPGYLLSEGQVAENLWLTGDKFGWRGPWGTTYAANLRLFVKGMTEEQWVAMARTLKTRPPMPWFNLNEMHKEDLQAIDQFLRYLGPGGEAAPAYVPPDQEPKTPYALFPSPPKKDRK